MHFQVFVDFHCYNLASFCSQDFKTGRIDEWLVAEGDAIKVGQDICHVSVGDLVVGVESQHAGVLAQICVPAGETEIAADCTIALCVDTAEDYTRFLQKQLRAARESIEAAAPEAVAAPAAVAAAPEPEAGGAKVTDLLREVRALINSGVVVEESDFAKKLLSQCRKGNRELLSVFEASFEGETFDHATFDANFFLDNAKDILEELETAQLAGQDTPQTLPAYKDSVDEGAAAHIHQTKSRE